MKLEFGVSDTKLNIWEEFEKELVGGKDAAETEAKLRALVLNGHTLPISKDKAKLKSLKDALQSEFTLSSSFFKDSELPYLAASLFEENFLNWTEFTTLLELHQATLLPPKMPNFVTRTSHIFFKKEEKIPAPRVQTFKIVDEKGEFTSEANHYLFDLKGLTGHEYYRHLTPQLLSQWKKLLLDSEKNSKTHLNNLFYVHTPSPQENKFDEMGQTVEKAGLRKFQTKRLSRFANHLLSIIAFHNDYKPMIQTIGNKTPQDIIKGVLNGLRFGFIYFPNFGIEEVHGQFFSYLSASLHDEHHSRVLTILKDYIQVSFYMADLIRNKILTKIYPKKSIENLLSKEIWELFDADIPMRFNKTFTSLSNAEIFSLLYFSKYSEMLHFHADAKEINYDTMQDISDVGIVTLVDMVKNHQHWEKLDCKPDELIGLAKVHFGLMQQFNIWSESDEENVIAYRLILDVQQRIAMAGIEQSKIQEFVPRIAEELKILGESCHFVKNKKSHLLSLTPKNDMPLNLFIQMHSLRIIQDGMLIPIQTTTISP